MFLIRLIAHLTPFISTLSASGAARIGLPAVGAPSRRDRAKRSEPDRLKAQLRRDAAPLKKITTSLQWLGHSCQPFGAYREGRASRAPHLPLPPGERRWGNDPGDARLSCSGVACIARIV